MLTRNKRIIAMASVILLALTILGCSALINAKETDPGTGIDLTPDPPSDETEIVLYFADWQAQHVIPERRRVTQVGDQALAEVVVRELIEGPSDPYLNATLPDKVSVISVEVEENIAYVNFSQGIRDVYGSAGETMAVRSLVYSLTELEGVDLVQILIEGKRAETLSGHFLLDEPLGRGEIQKYPVFIDEERAEWLQNEADDGGTEFRTQPLEVARFDGRMFGFTGQEPMDLVFADEEVGIATVVVASEEQQYAIHLVQPVKTGEDGIWMVEGISDYGIDSGRYVGRVDNNFIEVKITGVPDEIGGRVFQIGDAIMEDFEDLNLNEGDLIRFRFVSEREQQPVIIEIEKME